MACPLADSFCKYVRVSQYFAQGNEYGWSPYWVRNEYGTFRNARAYQYKLIVRRVRKNAALILQYSRSSKMHAFYKPRSLWRSTEKVRTGYGSGSEVSEMRAFSNTNCISVWPGRVWAEYRAVGPLPKRVNSMRRHICTARGSHCAAEADVFCSPSRMSERPSVAEINLMRHSPWRDQQLG